MRLRHIPGSEAEIENSPYVVTNPEEKKGRWKEVFGNNNPIEIEAGMGKGRFIMELAVQNPAINYVGIERCPSVLLRGIQKCSEIEPANIFFVCADVRKLSDIFAPGEVNKIYLNFSDPWPKERHAKRRLTSKQFMSVYDKILAPAGDVEFKTDNRGLFDFSLESMPACGWVIQEHTYDLHHSKMAKGNIMTEYEEKFSFMGNPIFKLTAKRTDSGPAPIASSAI